MSRSKPQRSDTCKNSNIRTTFCASLPGPRGIRPRAAQPRSCCRRTRSWFFNPPAQSPKKVVIVTAGMSRTYIDGPMWSGQKVLIEDTLRSFGHEVDHYLCVETGHFLAALGAATNVGDSMIVQQTPDVLGIIFSVFASNTFTGLYEQQELAHVAVYAEVSVARALLEQLVLVLGGPREPRCRAALAAGARIRC